MVDFRGDKWTKQGFQEFLDAVEYELDGLRFVSTGWSSECPDCGDEGCDGGSGFSWRPCECCGSTLGGERYPAHGVAKDDTVIHFDICTDCLFYLAYGQLDDVSMMEMDD